jgi:glycosyltransferase involved in cell wall biosynthesis
MSILRNNSRPRILFLTSHWPLAPAYGAQQRVLNIGRMLAQFANISWVIAPTEVEDEEVARTNMREYDIRAVIRPTHRAPSGVIGRSLERIRHEFDRSYMATDYYAVTEADRAKLLQLISEHDVVWVHTLRTAHWFGIQRWPHSVMDIDDLPTTDYRSRALRHPSLLKRLSYRRMEWIWKRREGVLLDRFDVLAVCSEADRVALKLHECVHVIPNGSSLQVLPVSKRLDEPILGFIGNCAFPPNEYGIRWFIKEVWPLIKSEVPAAKLRLVGAGSDRDLSGMGPDVVGCGFVVDPAEEIASWSAMIVPIQTGAGTRVKIADGFARKCPVVSTSYGAFGYEVADGRELRLADTPQEFAAACLQLIRYPGLGNELAERAYAKFLERWTWDSFQPAIEAAVQGCLARSASSTVVECGKRELQTQV